MNMDTIMCKELIVSTIALRGNGKKYSPIRRITQVFEKDGTLIAERDPSHEFFTATDLIDFSKWIRDEGRNFQITHDSVIAWLDSLEAKNQIK